MAYLVGSFTPPSEKRVFALDLTSPGTIPTVCRAVLSGLENIGSFIALFTRPGECYEIDPVVFQAMCGDARLTNFKISSGERDAFLLPSNCYLDRFWFPIDLNRVPPISGLRIASYDLQLSYFDHVSGSTYYTVPNARANLIEIYRRLPVYGERAAAALRDMAHQPNYKTLTYGNTVRPQETPAPTNSVPLLTFNH